MQRSSYIPNRTWLNKRSRAPAYASHLVTVPAGYNLLACFDLFWVQSCHSSWTRVEPWCESSRLLAWWPGDLGGILCSAGREREPVTWTPTRAGRAKLSTLGCEQLFSTPGSKISPPGRDDQNVCRVCSLQTWICRHCAVDDMSGKAPPCVKARNAFFLERKLLLQNLKFLKIIPSENIIAFLTSKLTAECN